VSCCGKKANEVKAACAELGLTISAEGTVGGTKISVKGVAELYAGTAFKAWFGGLAQLFEA
jgi:hypothetical protein